VTQLSIARSTFSVLNSASRVERSVYDSRIAETSVHLAMYLLHALNVIGPMLRTRKDRVEFSDEGKDVFINGLGELKLQVGGSIGEVQKFGKL
jgi:hypothetical protein